MRIVVALGGNALLERGERPDALIQRRHVKRAALALAPIAREHELIVCHGNGPQIGLLALESEADPDLSTPYPLDVLGAQTQGMIGYWLAQELHNAGVTRPVVTIVSQTVVDPEDPAFRTPTKFIGRTYPEQRAHELALERGWTVARDGASFRRVVASPLPVRVVEMPAIARAVRSGSVVICGGGGGVPVVDSVTGLHGVEAVIDKDRTAALIATRLGADRLIVLTDVPAVMRDFGTPDQRPIDRLSVDELASDGYPAGSMGPKIDACRIFVTTTGRPAAIGGLADAPAVLAGTAGTSIEPSAVAAVGRGGDSGR